MKDINRNHRGPATKWGPSRASAGVCDTVASWSAMVSEAMTEAAILIGSTSPISRSRRFANRCATGRGRPDGELPVMVALKFRRTTPGHSLRLLTGLRFAGHQVIHIRDSSIPGREVVARASDEERILILPIRRMEVTGVARRRKDSVVLFRRGPTSASIALALGLCRRCGPKEDSWDEDERTGVGDS